MALFHYFGDSLKNLLRSSLMAATLISGTAMASAPSKPVSRGPESDFKQPARHDYGADFEVSHGPQKMFRPAREARESGMKASRIVKKRNYDPFDV